MSTNPRPETLTRLLRVSKDGTFRIATVEGDSPAHAVAHEGGLALHCGPEGWESVWRITHVASGCAVAERNTKREALAALRRFLRCGVNWRRNGENVTRDWAALPEAIRLRTVWGCR